MFVERGDIFRALTLPCGQCVGCRLERSRQWAVRCMHEAQMHEENCFITLTYSEENLPQDFSLDYRHFQAFMKRLRSWFSYQSGASSGSASLPAERPKGIRFYMCGEYGEQFSRPHYHACIFGMDFPDKLEFRKLDSGSTIYTSKILESLWPYGYSSIGDVTFESAAYVARYIMKKAIGKNAETHYRRVIGETGEVVDVVPEFTRMSLKPGIGASWIAKYTSDVYTTDAVVMRGRKMKPPRYYDKYLALVDSDLSDFLEFQRYQRSFKTADDTTPERLADREKVTLAGLHFKKRVLE